MTDYDVAYDTGAGAALVWLDENDGTADAMLAELKPLAAADLKDQDVAVTAKALRLYELGALNEHRERMGLAPVGVSYALDTEGD